MDNNTTINKSGTKALNKTETIAAAENEAKVINEKGTEAYYDFYVPQVHRWGRLSMAVALFLSFLPIIYMYFILGWRADWDSYLAVIIAISSFGVGMWLTEPMGYFPILGSAGTYMGYFSGNVSNMRAPVALSVQSALNEDALSPRGSLATTIGIAMSVYVNLAILLVIIFLGEWLLALLPQYILNSFNYLIPALYGSLIIMIFRNNTKNAFKYGAVALVLYFIVMQFPQVATFALALVIGGTILFGYLEFKLRGQKANN